MVARNSDGCGSSQKIGCRLGEYKAKNNAVGILQFRAAIAVQVKGNLMNNN
jgi:hypothetical protein